MDCKEFRERLDPYVDGELSPEAAGAARAHLRACHACARAEAQLRLLRGTLKQVVSRHQPPPGFEAELRARLPELNSDARGARTAWLPRTAAAVWRARVSVPAPVLVLLVSLLVGLGVWAASVRMPWPTQTSVPSGPKARPASQEPAQGAQGELDLSRFYHGERASIYVVRRAGDEGGGR
jgi:anti-sigma factor RsiW